MIGAGRDAIMDVQVAMTNLRAALASWTISGLGSLIILEHGGQIRGGIDVTAIGDVLLTLDRDAEDLSVRIEAVELLLNFISSPSS